MLSDYSRIKYKVDYKAVTDKLPTKNIFEYAIGPKKKAQWKLEHI